MNRIVVLVLLAAAAAAFAAGSLGAEHATDLPVGLWWIAGSAALVVGAVAVGPRGTRRSARAAGGCVAAVVMAGVALAGIPHDLMVTISWTLQHLTGAKGLFDADPQWLTLVAELLLLGAAGVAAWSAVQDRRAAVGRCPTCGRGRPAAPAAQLGTLRALGIVAVVAPLPYAATKLAWGFGSDVGLTDPSLFDEVTVLTPGFGDTVLLCAVGVVTAAAMSVPWRDRRARTGLIGVGVIGSAMLLPVGAIGAGAVGQMALGVTEFQENGIALWTFGVVYGSFLAWGLSLAGLTWTYLRSTQRRCRDHRIPRPPVRLVDPEPPTVPDGSSEVLR